MSIPTIYSTGSSHLPQSHSYLYSLYIQSTLFISTSLISNNHLSRSENLVPVLTWKSNNRYQNIVEKRISPLSHNIFNKSLNFRSQITYPFIKCGCLIYCFPLSCKSDMLRYGYLEVFLRVPWASS